MILDWLNRWRNGSTVRIVYRCAWCRHDLPRKPERRERQLSDPQTGDIISHGICQTCAERLRAEL